MKILKRIKYFFSLLWRVVDGRKIDGKRLRISARTAWEVSGIRYRGKNEAKTKI